MRTHARPFASYEQSDTPKRGQIALWEGKTGSKAIYTGNIEMEDTKEKYFVNLFYPKDDKYSKAIYGGNISKNFGSGWETLGYINFFKSKSDKLVAVGFIKWKDEQVSEMRVLLFRNTSQSLNAPKFKGFLVDNERDVEEDRPKPKFRVSNDVEPVSKTTFDETAF